MTRWAGLCLAAGALALAACSKNQNMVAKESLATFDVAEAPPPAEQPPSPPGAPAVGAGAATVATAQPQIAYSYGYTYTLPNKAIAAAQARHVALCDALGTARCRIIKLDRVGGVEGEYATGSLELIVEARIARGLGRRLDQSVREAGGAPAGQTIAAEDLSKQIVDTEARIRAKQALADRLLGLIQTRNGKVGELVEAERAFADAQEELDAARSWMAEMRQRVAMSRVSITYATSTPEAGGAWSPVRTSIAESGRTFGESLGAMLNFVFQAAPWAALLLLLLWLRGKLGWRWHLRLPRWRRPPPAP